jgi:mercuric ion binding protein
MTVAMMLAGATASAGTIEIKVFGMVCGYCAQGVEKNLRAIAATGDVFVSIENKLVAVVTRDGQDIPDAALRKAITDAGYDVKGITRTQRTLDEVRGEFRQASR